MALGSRAAGGLTPRRLTDRPPNDPATVVEVSPAVPDDSKRTLGRGTPPPVGKNPTRVRVAKTTLTTSRSERRLDLELTSERSS
jgi:hypothetical protein